MLESGNIPVLNGSQGIYAQKQGKIKNYLDKHRLNTEKGEIVDNSEEIGDSDLFNRYFLSMSTVSVKVMNPSTAEWEEVITQVSFSSYQRNLINTFPIESMIALIQKNGIDFFMRLRLVTWSLKASQTFNTLRSKTASFEKIIWQKRHFWHKSHRFGYFFLKIIVP